MNGRIVCIGDVHGCIDELKTLIDIVEPSREDRIIFLGDLVDRGPDPVAVVRFVREHDYECVLGNHEEKHIRWAIREAEQRMKGLPNRMKPFTKERRAQHEALSADDLIWMSSLPPLLRFEWKGRLWIASHAGLPFDRRPEDLEVKALIRIRYLDRVKGSPVKVGPRDKVPSHVAYWADLWPGPESVVHGHIVHECPRVDVRPNGTLTLGIDTGCCFGGYLTAAIFDRSETPYYLSVKAARQYHPYLTPDD